MDSGDLRHEGEPEECWACDVVINKYHLPEDVAVQGHKASLAGSQVYAGRFGSEEGDVECFWCLESFELHDDRLYLNALDCAW